LQLKQSTEVLRIKRNCKQVELQRSIWAAYLTFGHTNPTTGGTAAVSQKLYTPKMCFLVACPRVHYAQGLFVNLRPFQPILLYGDRIFHDNKVKTVRHFFSSSFSIYSHARCQRQMSHPFCFMGPGICNLISSRLLHGHLHVPPRSEHPPPE